MKVTLVIDQTEVRSVEAYGDHVVVEGSCPKCGSNPFSAAGTGKRVEGHDTYAADAKCLKCGGGVGVLKVAVDTIFGIEEDERVMSGPWKVY